jgi:hypothetical protein
MKKIIALILTLVLILSMSISVSAANIPASARFYVYLEDFSYNLDEIIIWIQPEECTDHVLPEGKPSDLEFYDYIAKNWAGCRPGEYEYETKENLYSIFLPALFEGNFLEQNVTGNFIVMVQYTDPSSEEEQYYVTDLLNFFNEQNSLVIHFGDGTTEPTYRFERNSYIFDDNTSNACFVYGTRGEVLTTGNIISVDLEWGGMEFVYTPEQTIWNPDTHEYEEVLNEDGSSAAGWSVAEGSSNHIAITNHSNVPVEAVLDFASAEGKNINGYFENRILSCDSAAELAYNSPEKAPSDSTVFNIIRCEIDEETQGELGTITVTIRHREA